MDAGFKSAADAILRGVTTRRPRAPGVVAFVSDRDGDVYSGAAGVRRMGEDAAMTTDSVFALFSCTKAITATAALQLVEQGRLDLDAPARRHAPELGALRVLEGFDDAGGLVLRAPRREITTRMLMLHTAGFGYDFLNPAYKRLTERHGQISFRAGTKQGLMTPLLFDPGERWEYGLGLDWCGLVVEGVIGERLDAIVRARVLAPLGMRDTGHALSAAMRARRATMHQRGLDGALTPLDAEPLANPEVIPGGSGMYGSVGDYMRFLRMWLNDGRGETARVLKPETIAMAARNGLGDLKVRPLPGVIANLSNDVDFFPGLSKSWALSFMVNDEIAPTGRPAGSLGWAGLGNLYYWLDRENGVAGFWATQIFPFMDPTSLGGFTRFETEVYRGLKRAAAG
jgi:methyl acetate hydrolase